MTTINSITANTGNNKPAYSAKGWTGLASGIDTESVVEAMTSDIQEKINKVEKEQQKYTWKKEQYQAIIKDIIGMQDTYFSFSNPSTNLLSSTLFNCTKQVANGANAGKINVTSTSTNQSAAYSIKSISQLATQARYTTMSAISDGSITTGVISFGSRAKNIAEGKEMTIKYDNVEYKLTVPDGTSLTEAGQAKEMAAALNKAMAGISVSGSGIKLSERLKFETIDNKLTLGTVSNTDSRSFEIANGDAQLLNAIGFSKGDSGTSTKKITGSKDVAALVTTDFSLENKKLTFDLNGTTRTITFDATDDEAIRNAQDTGGNVTDESKLNKLAEIIQRKLNEKFNPNLDSTSPTYLTSGSIQVSANAGKLSFKTADESSVMKITSTTSDTMGKTGIFGISSGATNRLDMSKTLSELGITPTVVNADDPSKSKYEINVNGKSFSFDGSTQLSTVISQINNNKEAGINITYLNTTNRFIVSADDYGSAGVIDVSDSSTGGDLAKMLFGGTKEEINAKTTQGQDLIMNIRYEGESSDTVITRNSNSVSLDGINFTATGTFESSTEAITFTKSSDTENTISVIKKFAEAYNSLIDKVNEAVTTKRAKTGKSNKNGGSFYEPLTAAQKKEMTADEIKLWNEKAQQGLLFGDGTLASLGSALRFAFSAKVGAYGSAADIGITVASSYSGNGKITIDEKKLKEALENNAESVKSMFTASAADAPSNSALSNSAGGFATRIKGILEGYAKSTGAYKGKLVAKAGLNNNSTTTDNFISRQQKILENKLTYLKDLLAKRQDRYQSRFTLLERHIAAMNSQSQYFASMMG